MKENIRKHLEIYKMNIKESSDAGGDEVISLIKNYTGENQMINDFKGRLLFNKELTPKQKSAAEDFFTNEKLRKTILSNLDPSNELGRRITKKGIETYLTLLKTDKKFLFKPKDDRNVKVGTPSEAWTKRNIDDLKKFQEKLSDEQLSKWVNLPDGGGILRDKIDEILEILENKPESFFGFIENGEWSIVNKLDTNWSNWFRIIAELDSENKLVGNTPEEKIENFFKQVPVSNFLHPNSLNGLRELEQQYNIEIPTISRAEYEILKEFNKDFLNVRQRILKSTLAGDRNEENIRGTFKLFLPKENNEISIIDFSSHGNRVDQVFGVDMMIHMYVPEISNQKYWVPIQAKSDKDKANKSKLLEHNIDGIAIFPTKNPELKPKGEYAYLTKRNGTERSLSDLLEYNQQMSTKKG